MRTQELEALSALIKRAVIEALGEKSIFPLYTTVDVAAIFKVSPNTVLSWRQAGLLKAHVHLVSGCAWRWLFTNRDVLAFFDENFPSEHDLGSDFNPKSSKVIQMRKLLSARRLYALTHSRRKASND